MLYLSSKWSEDNEEILSKLVQVTTCHPIRSFNLQCFFFLACSYFHSSALRDRHRLLQQTKFYPSPQLVSIGYALLSTAVVFQNSQCREKSVDTISMESVKNPLPGFLLLYCHPRIHLYRQYTTSCIQPQDGMNNGI